MSKMICLRNPRRLTSWWGPECSRAWEYEICSLQHTILKNGKIWLDFYFSGKINYHLLASQGFLYYCFYMKMKKGIFIFDGWEYEPNKENGKSVCTPLFVEIVEVVLRLMLELVLPVRTLYPEFSNVILSNLRIIELIWMLYWKLLYKTFL